MKIATFGFITLLIICWTFDPFFKKHSMQTLSPDESMIFNKLLSATIIGIYLMYLIFNKKCDFSKLKNMTKKEMIFISASAISTFVSAVALINLLQREDVGYLMPQIQPLVILLTMCVGYFIFKEKISYYQIIGGVLIIGGVVFLNKKKK
jgi:uncharacterized membrane protein